jgi:hypothetical protein
VTKVMIVTVWKELLERNSGLSVSKTYAGELRTGKSLPHPRHWQRLAKLVGLSKDQQTRTIRKFIQERY